MPCTRRAGGASAARNGHRTSWRGKWPAEEGGTELEAEAEEGELEEGDTELEEGELAGAAALEAEEGELEGQCNMQWKQRTSWRDQCSAVSASHD